MKRSPFSGLSLTDQDSLPTTGIDQRLFSLPVESARQRHNGTTGERDNVVAQPPDNTRTRQPDSVGGTESSTEASQDRATAVTGRAVPRQTARHSHDIYLDQVRWLNRTRFAIEERYGVRVSSNAIVRLALDVMRDDHVRHGERSKLMRILVDGERWDPAIEAAPAEESEARP